MSIIFYKKEYTETLSEMLLRFNLDYPELEKEKKTYAGRLDPLAEGVIPILTGVDVHKKNDYISRDKIYQVDFIFGVSTDTYDILGLIEKKHDSILKEKNLEKHFEYFMKKKSQKYPAYSSKPVQGKALYLWAREKLLHSITIPKRDISIHSLKNVSKKQYKKDELQYFIVDTISAVNGDFRQKDIIDTWNIFFKETIRDNFMVYTLELHVSSGTYIRSIINELGDLFGEGACSLKIRRIKIDSLD